MRCRVVDAESGVAGVVFVTDRHGPDGVVTGLDAAAHDPQLLDELLRWGLALSRATGSSAAQVWCARGDSGQRMHSLGLKRVRSFLRMDRSLTGPLPDVRPVGGYRLVDGTNANLPSGGWADVHNRSFADHWRFSPRTEAELAIGRKPELCLLALDPDGTPAAITIGQIRSDEHDPRPQPVGLVRSVGTIPQHRRKGLAAWLVPEAMHRLQAASAPYSSLYVDGLNATRAFDLYRNLGYELAFESDVWEAVF